MHYLNWNRCNIGIRHPFCLYVERPIISVMYGIRDLGGPFGVAYDFKMPWSGGKQRITWI
jgi:hypothetical protein